MRDVLRRATFTWTDEAQSSFEQVKLLITDNSALALFDPSLPTIVSTDASDYGIGGVLTQLHPDNSERAVAFASRSLSAADRKYSVVEKEALACVWAAELWRTYLWGTKFTLRTNHEALTIFLATKGMGRAGMRVARWSARLLCFNYDIVHRPVLRTRQQTAFPACHCHTDRTAPQTWNHRLLLLSPPCWLLLPCLTSQMPALPVQSYVSCTPT